MTNAKTLFQQLQKEIRLNEEPDEIKSILYLLFKKEFGLTRTDILAEKRIEGMDAIRLNSLIHRINQSEPIQYILEEAEFFGRKFWVNASVLIPRPETELIVSLVKEDRLRKPIILDIGTGSGCIALSLAMEIPSAQIHALDISEKALAVAQQNARRLNTTIHLFQCDILHQTPSLTNLDVIVSNPPYVMEKEKNRMSKNVLDFEPSQALFVPDDDPLIFYQAIAKMGKELLRANGILFTEINAALSKETNALFQELGYDTTLFRDMESKDRVIKAVLR